MSETFRVTDETVTTRRRARAIAADARDVGASEIDLAGVGFVSRSVADEFVHRASEYGIELAGASGDVERMIEAVRDPKPVTA